MQERPYKLGLIIGRFQPVHKGHERMIRQALLLCDKVVVMIGSADKHSTPENPWYCIERESMICSIFEREYFENRLYTIPLCDINVGDNKEWGKYVLRTLSYYELEKPDLYITGNELVRQNWFEGLNTTFDTLVLNRGICDYSGTEVRDALLNGDKETFYKLCGQANYTYDELREQILKVNGKDDVKCN